MEEYRTILLASSAAIVAIVVVAIAWAIVRRHRRARALQAPLPLIPFSTSRTGTPSRPRVDGTLAPHGEVSADWSQAQTPAWSPPVTGTGSGGSRSTFAPPPPHGVDWTPATPGAVSDSPLGDTARRTDAVSGAAVDGASMRYWRPADGTLQFLPGRLEVVAGSDAGQEIRFVRTPGPDGTRVTFGRADGAPYRHVQLREPTVSRTHARMTLETGLSASSNASGAGGSGGSVDPGGNASGGIGAAGDKRSDIRATPVAASVAGGGAPRWRLENLSATNPVVVNGRPLATDGGPAASVCLGEGDRIEMGEVVFVFHEK